MIFLPQEDELSLLHLLQIQVFPLVPLYRVGRGLCFNKLFLDPPCSREANTAVVGESLHALLMATKPAEG